MMWMIRIIHKHGGDETPAKILDSQANMTMWKYASPVVRMFLSIHAKFVDNALYKARRALGE